MKLSVVVPVYNESEILGELHRRLKNAAAAITNDVELIFVNDGSRDDSIRKLREIATADSQVRYIDLSRNFGHQIAVTAGLENCNGDLVVIIDGDLQDPPELMVEMYEKIKEGFDVAYARRATRKGESQFKLLTAKLFYRILKKSTHIDIPVDTGDYRMMTRRIADALLQMTEQSKYYRGQVAWLGFKQTAVLFDREERRHGQSGYPFKKMLNFAIDGITSFSDVPLKLVTLLGLVISIIAFFVVIYALYAHFIAQDTVSGWTSIIISSMFIGGIQLVCLGLIGEYVLRIYQDVRKRPLYFISEKNF